MVHLSQVSTPGGNHQLPQRSGEPILHGVFACVWLSAFSVVAGAMVVDVLSLLQFANELEIAWA